MVKYHKAFHLHHVNHQATFWTHKLYLSISLMVIVASIYLSFHIKVGVGTFLLTLTPPKIPSDCDSMTPTPTPQPWCGDSWWCLHQEIYACYGQRCNGIKKTHTHTVTYFGLVGGGGVENSQHRVWQMITMTSPAHESFVLPVGVFSSKGQ
jgi:hypothetical protein